MYLARQKSAPAKSARASGAWKSFGLEGSQSQSSQWPNSTPGGPAGFGFRASLFPTARPQSKLPRHSANMDRARPAGSAGKGFDLVPQLRLDAPNAHGPAAVRAPAHSDASEPIYSGTHDGRCAPRPDNPHALFLAEKGGSIGALRAAPLRSCSALARPCDRANGPSVGISQLTEAWGARFRSARQEKAPTTGTGVEFLTCRGVSAPA